VLVVDGDLTQVACNSGRESLTAATRRGSVDAEYCALASVLDCRLVTLDGRLRRGADRLGFVVTPSEF